MEALRQRSRSMRRPLSMMAGALGACGGGSAAASCPCKVREVSTCRAQLLIARAALRASSSGCSSGSD